MAAISVCMIVKNEEAILARCLDSLDGLYEELVIVDTGSTDRTKEIAKEYGAKLFSFPWVEDFSAARNFAFSKCTKDYIYSVDADEVLDEINRQRFLSLKKALLPEVEIVQMLYVERDHQTVLNSAKEYRPKLFKRKRSFTWIDPIHETVRLDPVVFDSDIEIMHLPQKLHASRDFSVFESAYAREGRLSRNLYTTYAKELLKCGTDDDFIRAGAIFEQVLRSENLDLVHLQAVCCVLAHAARVSKDDARFIKYASKVLSCEACSEICYEMGQFFFDKQDFEEASLWFFNAAYETECVLDIHRGGDMALEALSASYEGMASLLEAEITGEHPNVSTSDQNFRTIVDNIASLRNLAKETKAQADAWIFPEI